MKKKLIFLLKVTKDFAANVNATYVVMKITLVTYFYTTLNSLKHATVVGHP